MAKPILLDRFKDGSYSQTQLINDKLDFLIGEFREVKQDIRDMSTRIDKLNAKIDDVDKKLDEKIDGVEKKLDEKIDGVEKKLDEKIDGVEDSLNARIDKLDTKIENVEKKLDAKIEQTRADLKGDITEIKQEIRTTRWQAFGVVVAQICSIGAIVWAIVSALK